MIFGAGTLTGSMPSATRGNFTSRSPDSYAFLDASAGDYFPAFTKRLGYDHIVLYGLAAQWTLLKISHDAIEFPASPAPAKTSCCAAASWAASSRSGRAAAAAPRWVR